MNKTNLMNPLGVCSWHLSSFPRTLGKPMGLRNVVVTGGRDTVIQRHDLDMRPQVGIATPGRFADHIDNNSTFSKSRVRNLVLDKEGRLLEGNTTLL